MRIAVIDNYDSFVYNLCDYFGRHPGVELSVYRNDEIEVEEAVKEAADCFVISPGPGRPEKAGISMELIKNMPEGMPLLGVCLGHQALACAFGGSVERAPEIFHGKTSEVFHEEDELFSGIPSPFEAARYHSLIVSGDSFPADLEITAKTSRGEIMGIKHRELPLYGVQFHPESILTGDGLKLVENFMGIVKRNKK